MEHTPSRRTSTETWFRYILQWSLFVQVGGMFFSIALSSIAFGIAVFSYIGLIFSAPNKRDVLVKTGLEWYFAAYIVAVAIMVAFAIYPESALTGSRRVLLILIVFMLPAAYRSTSDVVRFLVLLAAVILVQSSVEFGFYLAGEINRINFFQHYMTAGGMKMILLLMLIPLLFIKDITGWRRVLISLGVLMSVVTLVLTQTRSSWMGFGAGILMLAGMQFRKIFIAIPIAAVLFLLLAPADVQERVADMVKLSQSGEPENATVASNMNRVRMWKTGLQIFTEYPLTGVGDGEVWHIYRRYVTPEDPAEGGHFHNTYIQLLATHGIIGFLAAMAMFIAIVRLEFRFWRRAKQQIPKALALGALAAFAGFAVNGLAEYNFGDHEILVLLWFTVGVAVVFIRQQAQDIPLTRSEHDETETAAN